MLVCRGLSLPKRFPSALRGTGEIRLVVVVNSSGSARRTRKSKQGRRLSTKLRRFSIGLLSRRSCGGRGLISAIRGLGPFPKVVHQQGIEDRRDAGLDKRPNRPRGRRPHQVVEKRSDRKKHQEKDPSANRASLKRGFGAKVEKVFEHPSRSSIWKAGRKRMKQWCPAGRQAYSKTHRSDIEKARSDSRGRNRCRAGFLNHITPEIYRPAGLNVC